MKNPLSIISAGRTRDLAGWQPEHLAEVLAGRAPARCGPRSAAFFIDLDEVGAVVLWTKQPAAMLASPQLSGVRLALRERQILVQLQLSVTGLGGSPLEPGIPEPDETAGTLEMILERGLLAGPDCVKLRWDPVACYDLGGGVVLSNAREDCFARVFKRFQRMGAVTWTSSLLDLKYQGATRRLKEAGVVVTGPEPDACRLFYTAMADRIEDVGGRFSLCCSPALEPWVSSDGCIDGEWINGLRRRYFGERTRLVETVGHNEKRKGGQRPRCGCSYSMDISYATGFRTCATQYAEGGSGGCCLYCYSWHGRTCVALAQQVADDIARLRRNPLLEGAGPFWHRALGFGVDR